MILHRSLSLRDARASSLVVLGAILGLGALGAAPLAAGTPCTYSLSPPSANVGSGSSFSSLQVTTPATSCPWTAVSNSPFLTILSGSSGSGNGAVNYSVAANPGPQRTGTMTIAGLTFTVTQAGSAAEIPAIGGSGLVFLVGAVAAAGIVLARRRRVA